MESISFLNEVKEGIIALGVIGGAVWAVLRLLHTPKKVAAVVRRQAEHEARIVLLESKREISKVYFAGLKEDVSEVKNKVDRIEELLLKGPHYGKNN